MNERGVFRISPDNASLMRTAAETFVTVTRNAIAARGRAEVVVTGGSTPRPLYELLATAEYSAQIDWSRVGVWFSDDRCVAPDDIRSNYGMIRDALLAHIDIPEANVHRMIGEATPIEAGATQYEEAIRTVFSLAAGELPHFDFILLGIGPDGHVASLFPGTTALETTDRLVVAVEHRTDPPPHVDRISLTMPVLNAARVVAYLTSGEDKAPMIARVIEETLPVSLPAQRVMPTDGELLWLLDVGAAGDLHR